MPRALCFLTTFRECMNIRFPGFSDYRHYLEIMRHILYILYSYLKHPKTLLYIDKHSVTQRHNVKQWKMRPEKTLTWCHTVRPSVVQPYPSVSNVDVYFLNMAFVPLVANRWSYYSLMQHRPDDTGEPSVLCHFRFWSSKSNCDGGNQIAASRANFPLSWKYVISWKEETLQMPFHIAFTRSSGFKCGLCIRATCPLNDK